MRRHGAIAAAWVRAALPCLVFVGLAGLASAQTLVGPDIELREGALVVASAPVLSDDSGTLCSASPAHGQVATTLGQYRAGSSRHPAGGDWDAHNFERVWRRLRVVAARNGVRPLRLHDCRHTFATLALEGGKSVTWVSRVLGHSDPATTLRVYAHVLPEESGGLDFFWGVGQRWAEISPPQNPLTQPFDYVEENGDPGAIRGRAQLAKRIRGRASPACFANARPPASEAETRIRIAELS